jgi:hypothetical protein
MSERVELPHRRESLEGHIKASLGRPSGPELQRRMGRSRCSSGTDIQIPTTGIVRRHGHVVRSVVAALLVAEVLAKQRRWRTKNQPMGQGAVTSPSNRRPTFRLTLKKPIRAPNPTRRASTSHLWVALLRRPPNSILVPPVCGNMLDPLHTCCKRVFRLVVALWMPSPARTKCDLRPAV